MISLGIGLAASARTASAPVPGPVNTVPPVLSGASEPGGTLTLGRGSWSGRGALSYTLEIRADARLLASGTAATLDYTVTEADRGETIFGLVRARDDDGTRLATSGGLEIPESTAVETHVFLLAGQSNATSIATFDDGADWPTGAFQMERWDPLLPQDVQPAGNEVAPSAARIIPASRPLHHHRRTPPGEFGWALQFTLDYMTAHPDTNVVLIPAAHGGTGFSGNRWNPGDDLYDDAVARANALMAGHPDFIFAGILWHQGEADADSASEVNAYQTALDAMIPAMRADIAVADATTPFVLGGLVDTWVNGVTLREQVQAIIADTPNRLLHTAHASSVGTSDDGETVHFGAQSMRVMGARYAAALVDAAANASRPPAQVTGLVAQPGDGVINLSWNGPDPGTSPLTGYVVRRDGVQIATPSGRSYGDTGLTNGTVYAYTVAATSAAGAGPPSDTATATPQGSAAPPPGPGGWSVSGSTVTDHPAPPTQPAVSGTTVS